MRQSEFLICLLVISSIIMMVPSSPKVFAAVITCVPSLPCDGTNNNDRMIGSEEPDLMKGLGGNDKMNGNGDRDLMEGGDGNDRMLGGDQIDILRGDNGNDYLDGGPDVDDLLGGDGDDQIFGRDGGDDDLFGGNGNDIIKGGLGDDSGLVGGNGADIINGGEGDDQIGHFFLIDNTNPDGSQDTIDCGPGNDEVWINVNTDHDTVKNCEIVHREKVPPI